MNEKVNRSQIYLKKIKKKLFSIDKYHKIIIFLIKLILILKMNFL